MAQSVVCDIERCGFRSGNGFCLRRVVHVTGNGVCQWLEHSGWEQQVDKKFKSTYRWWEENAAVAPAEIEAGIEEKQGLSENDQGLDKKPG